MNEKMKTIIIVIIATAVINCGIRYGVPLVKHGVAGIKAEKAREKEEKRLCLLKDAECMKVKIFQHCNGGDMALCYEVDKNNNQKTNRVVAIELIDYSIVNDSADGEIVSVTVVQLPKPHQYTTTSNATNTVKHYQEI